MTNLISNWGAKQTFSHDKFKVRVKGHFTFVSGLFVLFCSVSLLVFLFLFFSNVKLLSQKI